MKSNEKIAYKIENRGDMYNAYAQHFHIVTILPLLYQLAIRKYSF